MSLAVSASAIYTAIAIDYKVCTTLVYTSWINGSTSSDPSELTTCSKVSNKGRTLLSAISKLFMR